MRNILRGQFVFLVAVISSLALAQPTIAAEPICPGGDNARADIVWCADFDTHDNCVNGTEVACWKDNGYSDTPPFYTDPEAQLRIVSNGAAAGSGAVKGMPRHGGTGPGFAPKLLDPASAMSLRWYVKYEAAPAMGSHGPGLLARGNGCSVDTTFEPSAFNYDIYRPVSGCTDAGGNRLLTYRLRPNQPNIPIMRLNHWYMVEMQAIVDTQCIDPIDPHGCNGEFRMWVDEQLVMEYTDVNHGGTLKDARFSSTWGPREYHHRIPPWPMAVLFDNFAVSNTGAYIGRASNENALGTPDPISPYHIYNMGGGDAHYGRHWEPDCSGSGSYLSSMGFQWKEGGALVTEPHHLGQATPSQGCVDSSPLGTYDEKSLKVEITSSGTGGGISFEWIRSKAPYEEVIFPQQAVHGWIYLPSGNDYSQPPVLSGFHGYWGGKAGSYVGLTVSNDMWGVVQRYHRETSQVIASTVPVQFDQWVEFEIMLQQDQTVNLMINKARVFENKPLPLLVDWFFGNLKGITGIVEGVIEYQGTPPFTVYTDDVGVGTMSFWSCDGWHESSCPFSTTEIDFTPPAPPSGLRILPSS